MKFHAQNRCSFGEISKKPSWILENVVSTIYIKLLINEIHIYNFFTIDDVLVGKLTISASLKNIHFPRILKQAPLKGRSVFQASSVYDTNK